MTSGTVEFVCGNIFVRTSDAMKLGQIVHSHKHNFDHATLCAVGALRVSRKVDGVAETITVKAGDLPVLILAGVEHQLEAVEDGSVYYCIYGGTDWEVGRGSMFAPNLLSGLQIWLRSDRGIVSLKKNQCLQSHGHHHLVYLGILHALNLG